jgi:hypothetical protein
MSSKQWKLEHLRRVGVGVSLVGVACSAGDGGEPITVVAEAVQPSPAVDARRSLAITDQPILQNFGLKRVLDQLIATSGVTGLSSTTLFQQWWDTQNAKPGLGLGAHCDDSVDGGGYPVLNSYPYTCRPAPGAEGGHAECDPFAVGSTCAYIPVGLFMRFDLAPEDGSHCGEYRIVYAKESGRTESQNRNLLIFEAVVDNPHVNQGIRGCEKFVRAWAELSNEPDLTERSTALEEFYFTGYKEFEPVVSYQNFGDNPLGAGQIRTNQFVQPDSPRVWSLREFKLIKDPSGSALRFVPVTNKTNPYGPLFDAASANPNAAGFQAEFLSEVTRLAGSSIGAIGLKTSDLYNSGQSQAANAVSETNYVTNFGYDVNPFRSAIESTLSGLGSSLTADDIVARAQAMSCAGCHRFSSNVPLGGGLTWPRSLGFTHVSERDVDLENVGGVTRYAISVALTDHLLPARKQIVENFLNEVPRPAKPPKDPLGGRFTH